jgi:hypothetical protein
MMELKVEWRGTVITVATARHDFAALTEKKHKYYFSIEVYKTFIANVLPQTCSRLWICMYIDG